MSYETKCVACANCVPVCLMGVIYIGDNGSSEINADACVECDACYKGMSKENLPQQPTRLFGALLAFFKSASSRTPISVLPGR